MVIEESWWADECYGSMLSMSENEEWCMEHMGVMAFWRTGISIVNLFLTLIIVLKVFEVL